MLYLTSQRTKLSDVWIWSPYKKMRFIAREMGQKD